MAQLNSRSLMDNVQTALISIGTTSVMACCGFLFKVNAALARIEQNLSNEIVIRNETQAKVSRVEVKVAALEITTAEIKAKQNPQ